MHRHSPQTRSGPLPTRGDFILWRPKETIATLDVEPILASWEAKSHPSKRRLQAYLDDVESALAPHLHGTERSFCLDADVVRPDDADLLKHHDLENYLTPLAEQLRKSTIVLASAVKRYALDAGDRSKITLSVVEQGSDLNDWNFASSAAIGSPELHRGKRRSARA